MPHFWYEYDYAEYEYEYEERQKADEEAEMVLRCYGGDHLARRRRPAKNSKPARRLLV